MPSRLHCSVTPDSLSVNVNVALVEATRLLFAGPPVITGVCAGGTVSSVNDRRGRVGRAGLGVAERVGRLHMTT